MKCFACGIAALALLLSAGCGQQQTSPNDPNPGQSTPYTVNRPVTPEPGSDTNRPGTPPANHPSDSMPSQSPSGTLPSTSPNP